MRVDSWACKVNARIEMIYESQRWLTMRYCHNFGVLKQILPICTVYSSGYVIKPLTFPTMDFIKWKVILGYVCINFMSGITITTRDMSLYRRNWMYLWTSLVMSMNDTISLFIFLHGVEAYQVPFQFALSWREPRPALLAVYAQRRCQAWHWEDLNTKTPTNWDIPKIGKAST